MVSSGFLQEPHGVTTQKTPFFIVTAVKTSNLTGFFYVCRIASSQETGTSTSRPRAGFVLKIVRVRPSSHFDSQVGLQIFEFINYTVLQIMKNTWKSKYAYLKSSRVRFHFNPKQDKLRVPGLKRNIPVYKYRI
jgi:hypothetical protein